MQISVFIACSLDGFIARPDGDIAWLNEANVPGDSADYGFEALLNSADYVVMGRKTFEQVVSFEGWHYSKPIIVCSKSLTHLPEKAVGKAEIFAGSLNALIKRCERENCQRLYIDGGQLIQSFLRAGLVTDLTITTIPILLGDGICLFGDLEHDIHLQLVSATGYLSSGFVQSIYQVKNS